MANTILFALCARGRAMELWQSFFSARRLLRGIAGWPMFVRGDDGGCPVGFWKGRPWI